MTAAGATINAARQRVVDRNARDMAEIDRLERLIARHKRKRESIRPPYAGAMLEEVFKEILSHMPGRTCSVSGPFGLGGEYGVSIMEGDANLAHFTFRSDGVQARLVDTSVDTGRFAPNSLGRVNGLHHPSMDMPEEIDVWIQMIEKQIAESRLRNMARG